MIIERLDLIGFGRFTNFTLDLSAGPHRFHIVYGPNESGKSTSLRAISDWLFGFQGTLVDDYVHASRNLRVGGRIAEPESNQVLECIRRKGNKDTLLDADNKTKISSAPLEAMLQGIDKEAFKHQFGISHQQLVEGGNLILEGKGDLSEILFSAGAGLGRLQHIRQQIADHGKAIYTDRKSSTPRLYQSLDEWESLQAKLREQSLLPTTYDSKRAELARVKAKASSCASTLNRARKKLEELRSIQQAAGSFVQRRRLLEKLAPLKEVTPLAPGFTEKRRELQSTLAVAAQQVESLKCSSLTLQRQLEDIQVDEAWLTQEASIERLNRNITQHEQAAVATNEKRAKLAQVRERVAELTQHLGALDADDALPCEGLPATARAELVTLANQYSGVMQRVTDAEEKLHAAKTAARKLRNQLKTTSRPGSPSLLEDAIRSIGQPQPLLAAQSRAAAQVDVARENANAKLQQLTGFDGMLEQAVALSLPPRSSINARIATIDAARQSLQALEEAIRITDESRDRVQQRILDQSAQSSLPDPAHVESLRVQRDQWLGGLLDASTQGIAFPVKQAIELRDHVFELDRIHALRHQHHDHVLRREQDDRQLQQLDEQILKQREERETLRRTLASAMDDWRALWSEIGVVAGDIDEMRSWCQMHQQVVEAASELSQRCIEWQLATDAVDRAAVTLRSAIKVSLAQSKPAAVAAIGPSDSMLFDLDDEPAEEFVDWPSDTQCVSTLHAYATRLSRELESSFQAYEALSSRCESAVRECEGSQADFDAARSRLEAWQQRWSSAVEPLSSLGAVTPDSVDMLLKSVEEIARLRRDAVAIEDELDELRSGQAAFRDSVFAVARTCAPQWLEVEPSDDEITLVTRMLAVVKMQRENQKKRDLLLEQLNQTQAAAVKSADQCRQIQTQLEQMCVEADCDAVEGLAECERRSDERRQLIEKIDAIEASLSSLARGRSIDDFENLAAQYAAVSIDSEIETIHREIEAGEREQEETQQTVGQLSAEMRKMDGSDQAAQWLQQQQSLMAKIRREAEEYAKLAIAQDVLAKAIETYRRANEGTVLAKAGQYFSRMTCQQYRSLQVEFDSDDKPQLYAIRSESHSAVPAARLSDGTADALYLAMRIASLDVHLHKNHPIPLIIDDCLIQFDDQRATAVLEILSELSLRTQVILFTHHDHVIELATARLAKDHFHLHCLEA